MARITIEKDKDKYTLSCAGVTNSDIGELIGYAQVQAGLRFVKLGMDIEEVKSALVDLSMAACETIDDLVAKERMEQKQAAAKEVKKKKQKHQFDTGKIMALHNAGWSNADIAKEMETLEGQIDYIIRKEKKDEKSSV